MKITPRFFIISLYSLLISTLPLYFRFVNEELFEFNKMILVYFFTVLISFAWIVRMIVEKKLIFKRTPFDFAILFFVFSQLIATVFSIHPHTSWLGYYSRFNGGFLSTISYVVLFYGFVSNYKKQDLGGFFISSFFSGLLVAIYGILEHFGHSISCLFVPGTQSFGVDCWIQDVQSRVFATFGQPNWLAAYVITLFPLSLVASIQKNLTPWKRVFFGITTLALFIVLIYTRSRSGMIGLLGGMGLFALGTAVLFIKNKKEVFTKVHAQFAASILFLLVGITAVLGTSVTPSLQDLFTKHSATNTQETPITPQIVNRLEEGGTDSGEIRKIVWEGAYKVWQRYPIIGSGVETFAYSYYQDRTQEHNTVSEWDFLYNKAHNELLNILATSGLFGLLTYVSIFVVFAGIGVQLLFSKIKLTEKLIVIALLSGQFAVFISNFFGFSTVAVNVLTYCYLAILSILYIEKNTDINAIKNSKRTKYVVNDTWQYLALTTTGIVMLVLIFKICNYWAADVAYAQGKAQFEAGQFQVGIQKQLEAIERSPNEALYYDTLSDNYAKLAVHFANINEATAAAQMVQETVAASNETLRLNNRHLNFYKTRARVFVTLAQLDEAFLEEAKSTLKQAIQLSPTDPKLVYTLAVIEQTSGNLELALDLYEQSIQLKPDYERPYWKISEIYEAQNKFKEAITPLEYILENISPNNEDVLKQIKLLQTKMTQK